jgi:hypothetical protein
MAVAAALLPEVSLTVRLAIPVVNLTSVAALVLLAALVRSLWPI